VAEEGLAKALEKLVAAMQVRSDVPVTFAGTATSRLSAAAETAIFRIVQESLSNASKYARATAVTVTLTEVAGCVRVEVRDDGVGFDPSASVTPSADGRRGGMGLPGMRARAAEAGLSLRVTSAPGAGTSITVEAPLP
jgi:signal transduction histidine kinase